MHAGATHHTTLSYPHHPLTSLSTLNLHLPPSTSFSLQPSSPSYSYISHTLTKRQGHDGGVCDHRRMDSVLGVIVDKFKEIVIYDRAQCYPEFLIEYERSTVVKPQVAVRR